MRKHLPALLRLLPQARVVTVNLQPVARRGPRGGAEIVLTDAATLPMPWSGSSCTCRPRASSRPTPRSRRRCTGRCRVGRRDRSVLGLGPVLRRGRVRPGLRRPGSAGGGGREPARRRSPGPGSARARPACPTVLFEAGDATDFARSATGPPDLVVVNPPRRGIGAELAGLAGEPRRSGTSSTPAATPSRWRGTSPRCRRSGRAGPGSWTCSRRRATTRWSCCWSGPARPEPGSDPA
jgi:23S rRNA (uracil747-C5)-methyltransferase